MTYPCRIHAGSYLYWPWALEPAHYLTDPATLNDTGSVLGLLRGDFQTAMLDLVTDMVSACTTGDASAHDADISEGNLTIYRLREGIERFFISDINNPAATAKAQSEIPVMHDEINANIAYMGAPAFNHLPGGGNVLFMDGHVKFIRYPGEFPVCATWASFLAEVGALF
ncbi:MAG: hypothetical protein GY851_25560 [bacterium]|nr:hypothetical protein [bacterium]